MDDPVAEVSEVILKLTKGSPRTQQAALEQYFTPKSSFFHPFCSVHHNRTAILRIFQWYKIMSPHIEISINSIAYDSSNLTLYVNISQVFRIFVVPFYRAPVTLTTVLQLERGHNLNLAAPERYAAMTPAKYYIRSQNDLYQIDQFIRFALPWGVGTTLILLWHWLATLCCIVGARLGAPLRWTNQALADAKPAYPDVSRYSLDGDDDEDLDGKVNGDGTESNRHGWVADLKTVSANEKRLLEIQEQQRCQF